MNRDPRGLYAALGVSPDATPAEIQRSFRALMRLRHPDLGAGTGGRPDNGAEARRILESFAVLRDPASRAAYDPGAGPEAPAGNRDPAVGRAIPVRHHAARQPVLRITPVRWER
ncbi:J domain-containing protein [Arthrobacter sp. Hor0625]|uniref:J domain-containing protein n=1 Tax=Arthrobacter sp. Hor0625 TaxID=3457358 RepID=UPI00403E7193